MTRLLAALALAVALGTSGASAAYAEDVRVEQEKTTVSTSIGERFSFTSTIRAGDSDVQDLVAHLNIVGLDPEVYVDPEDWSGERTQYIDELSAGESKELSWTVQAVNDGEFLVYVALATPDAGGPVTAGPALKADVAAQRMINAGGIVPIAVAVPGVLLLATIVARLRSRRRG